MVEEKVKVEKEDEVRRKGEKEGEREEEDMQGREVVEAHSGVISMQPNQREIINI